jgi:hypothetical protein
MEQNRTQEVATRGICVLVLEFVHHIATNLCIQRTAVEEFVGCFQQLDCGRPCLCSEERQERFLFSS